jgi:DNA-binding beta-propeller fold protein YncE
MFKKTVIATILATATFSATAAKEKDIQLNQLGTYASGIFDDSAAEIVAYDPDTYRLFVINAADSVVDVLSIASQGEPTFVLAIDVAADFGSLDVGGINSVAVSDGLVAIAVENDDKQANGWVVFYDTDGNPLASVPAGALPDSVAFTPNGQYVLAANEGEPNGDYSVDPEGSVTVIDLRNGVQEASTMTASFSESTPLIGDVRLPAPRGASVAQDLEPEFIAVSGDSKTAWITLQENNAVAIVDIRSATVTGIAGLGYKDHSISGNGLDASDRDAAVNITNWPLYGVYMPDSIASFKVRGKEYVVTANEGDGREYLTDATDEADCDAQGGFDFDDGDCFHYLDELRVKDIEDTGATLAIDDAANLAEDENIGRINIITDLGVTGDQACFVALAETGQPVESCTYEALYSYGARSITVWDAGGTLVADTGDMIEQMVAARYPCDAGSIADESCPFNADNDENFSFDSRSDAKGPEPEGIAVGKVRGRTYAFVGLERVGGIMIFDLSNPENPRYVDYFNNRDFSAEDVENGGVGDLGPEGLVFIKEADSPIGVPLLVVGNEVSGTTTIYSITAN